MGATSTGPSDATAGRGRGTPAASGSGSAAATVDRPRVVLAGAVVLAVVLLVALLTTRGGDAGADAGDGYGVATAGEALPGLDGGTNDPAVGMPAPGLTGTGIGGETVNPTSDGRPGAVLFVAHWCPHCQREVPAVQAWIEEGGLPDGVDLAAVSTAETASRDNSDVEAWLEGEGWTVPTLRDVDGAAGEAYGVTGFPFWVFLDADDTVVARHSGQLPIDQLDAIMAELAARG